MELVYKHKKWDKQLQADERICKELGGVPSINNLNGLIEEQQLKDSVERNYQMFYSASGTFYASIARNYYLRDIKDLQSLYSVYLSGRSTILERLFATFYTNQGRKIFEEQRGIERFDHCILQMIAIGQPLPKCIQGIDNIYIQLLNKNVDGVKRHFENKKDREKLRNLYGNQISETGCLDIQMILQGDQAALRKRLIQRIKEDRKEPIDYFEIIDIYSTALIKLARIYGMDIDIDVIEIPKLFFNEECCKIDKSKIEVPFFEEALVVLKDNGILWDE